MAGREATLKSLELTIAAVKRDPSQYVDAIEADAMVEEGYDEQETLDFLASYIVRGLELAQDMVKRESAHG